MKTYEISIANDFSPILGGRFKTQGKFSGEEFRETILEPKVKKAIEEKAKIICNLDGCLGYPSSFLDESFGKLGRELKTQGINLLDYLNFISEDEPSLPKDIKSYIG